MQTPLPLSQVSGDVHFATDAVHLQTLLAESQYAPWAFPTQELAVPHLQTPLPLSQDSGDVQAATEDVHLHTLLLASQYAP